MYTAIAFIIGLFIGGVVCFFVSSCICLKKTYDKQKTYDEGYTAGYQAGLRQRGV